MAAIGREIDLSKVALTHHTLRNRGKQAMLLLDRENPKLEPLTDGGGEYTLLAWP